MQCNRSTSFSRQSGKTQRESQQSRNLCQSRKSRQARLNGEPEPKKLQTNPIEDDETSSSEEEQQFGPDKTSRKTKKSFGKPSKLSGAIEDYVTPFEMNRLEEIEDAEWTAWCAKVHPEIFKDSEPDLEDTRDEIPHHILWDYHLGVFPEYCQVLTQCTCWGCDYGRKKYKC
jgi:hypothetical protein